MDDVIAAGRHATRLLEDAVFLDAVKRADSAFVERWRAATTPEERERAHALQAALTEVLVQLYVIAGDGDMAARTRQ
jgi:hypothetical protein